MYTGVGYQDLKNFPVLLWISRPLHSEMKLSTFNGNYYNMDVSLLWIFLARLNISFYRWTKYVP